MNKSTIINISGIAFYIDEEAFQKLSEYLGKINKHFENHEDKQEIIEDIENRIAEKFSNSKTNSKSVIQIKDVEEIIEQMGSVKDFEEAEEEDKISNIENTSIQQPKKFYRSKEEQVIAGVCAGLAKYTNVNVDIIRIIFVILIFVPGSPSVWIYLLLMFLTSEAKTITEQMEMEGKSVTIKNIHDSVQEKEMPKTYSKLMNILLFPFKVIGITLPYIGNMIEFTFTKLLGIILSVFSLGFFFFITLFTTIFIFQNDSPLIDTPLKSFPDNFGEYSSVVFIYLSIIIPVIAIGVLGISIFRKKIIGNKFVGLSVFGMWIISIISGISLTFQYLPQIQEDIEVAYGAKLEKTEKFDSIRISNESYNPMYMSLQIIKSDTHAIELMGKRERAEYKIQDNELLISQNIQGLNKICFFCEEYVSIIIYTPTLKSIETNIPTDLTGFGHLESLNIKITGYSTNLYLGKGSVDLLKIDSPQGSNIEGREFTAKNLEANMKNRSAVFINVTDSIKFDLKNDSIIVLYSGNPKLEGENNPKKVFTQKEYEEYLREKNGYYY